MHCVRVCVCGGEFCAKAAVISPTQPILALKLLQADTTEHHTSTRGPTGLHGAVLCVWS